MTVTVPAAVVEEARRTAAVSVLRFYQAFGRPPDHDEQVLLVKAIYTHAVRDIVKGFH